MKHDIDINLELRSEILDASIHLEYAIDELLLALLVIEKPKRKAITNKSGNLSFKNKIDLLFDLDILIDREHQQLLLLMELRNQFLHNIECISFEKALDFLGSDKEKKLLKFADSENFENKEDRYKNAFGNLKIGCLEIVASKIDDRRNQLEDREKMLVNSAESQIFFINKYFGITKQILEIFEKSSSTSVDVFSLYKQIEKTISTDMELLQSSEEYTKLQTEFKELSVPEKIKALFKR